MEAKDTTAACPICCDNVYPWSCPTTIWAPCCRTNTWFHRDCVQRLALNAGYFFKCPLCNNKTIFQKAMLDYGVYIPEQDASWELEPNAFQELLHRHNRCDAKHCLCPKGRSHALLGTRWELVLCRYCGSQGIHVGCGNLKWSTPEWECDECSVMLQQAQERGDTDSDEEPDPSPASVNQFPVKRKRRYFKGSGESRRTKCHKRRSLSSSSDPRPSSSQSLEISKDGPTAMTGGPVSPPTPIAVIEISDDDDDDDDDDGGGGGGGGDNDHEEKEEDDDDDDDDDDVEIIDDGDVSEPPSKTSTPGNDRIILSCDGRAIPVIQVSSTAASDNGQNFCVVGDLDVKLPCQLYDVQQVAQPAASNIGISHISGAMVPGSSVDGSSFSKSLYSSVDGNSSSKSLYSSVDGSSSSKSLHSSVDGNSSSKSLHSSVDGNSSSRSLHSLVHGSSSSNSQDSAFDGCNSSKPLHSAVGSSSFSKPLNSSVGSSSTSKSLHSSGDGSSSVRSFHSSVVGSGSSKFINSSPAVTHSHQPSASGTARGSQLKSYLTSENAKEGCAYPAQVSAVAQQVDGKVSFLIFT